MKVPEVFIDDALLTTGSRVVASVFIDDPSGFAAAIAIDHLRHGLGIETTVRHDPDKCEACRYIASWLDWQQLG